MQKNYELLYIVHPDLEGSTEKISEKVAGFITKAGGKITATEDWGKRKLAYKIAKNEYGVYVLVNFAMESVKLHEVERDLRLSEEIMRSMIVAIPEISANKPEKKPRIKPEDRVEAKEEPASIIVKGEKPSKESTTAKADLDKEKPKAAPKKAVKTEEVSPSTDAQDETEVSKKPAAKKAAPKKAAPKAESDSAKATTDRVADEKERLKKLDEKLDELLK